MAVTVDKLLGTALLHKHQASDIVLSGTTGQVQFNNGGSFGGAAALTYSASGVNLTATAQAATDKPLVVKGATSQSANLFEAQNSSGALLATIGATSGTGGSLRIYRASDQTRFGEINYGTGGQGLRITDGTIYFENNNGFWDFSSAVLQTNGGFRVSNVAVALQMTDGAGQSAAIGRTLFDGGGIVRLYANSSGTGNGALRCGAPSASTVGLVVQGAASQSANLQEWQNSAGTALLAVGAPTGAEPVIWLRGQGTNSLGFRSNGIVQLGSGGLTTFNQFINLDDNGFYRGNFNLTLSDGNNQLLLQSGHTAFSSGRAAIVLNNSATVSTSDLLSVRNNGTAALIVGPGGNGYALNIPVLNASDRGIVVKGAASQSANLQEWQNSAGTVLASTSSAGRGSFNQGAVIVGINPLNSQAGFVIDGSLGGANGYVNCYLYRGSSGAQSAGFVLGTGGSNNWFIGTGENTNKLWFYNFGHSTQQVTIGYLAGDDRVVINTVTSGSKGLVVQGAASQSADLTQWQDSSSNVLASISAAGKPSYSATNTAAGTTGAQTINKPSGTVNFAAGATTLVVTNNLVTTSSIVFAVVRTNDTTATIKNVVPAAGSFTITLSAAATAETSVGFLVIN